MIIYKDVFNEVRTAKKSNTDDGKECWMIFTGKRGGKLRKYITITAMDKAMAKIGYTRQEAQS